MLPNPPKSQYLDSGETARDMAQPSQVAVTGSHMRVSHVDNGKPNVAETGRLASIAQTLGFHATTPTGNETGLKGLSYNIVTEIC